IPFGRPYHTQHDGVLKMLTTKKRVHPFPTRILANRRRFHSSSSSPCKRRKASPCTSSSAIHSSSSVSDGPSRKRCRSPTTDSSIIRADLLPPRKRLRDPSSTYCHKVSVEVSTKMEIKDSIEAGAEGDIERDTDDCPAITADTTTDAVAAVEGVRDYEVKDDAESSARGTAEIRIDVVTELEVPDDIPMPIIVESGSRKTFEIGIRVLEGSNIGLQDTLGVKREMTASIERSLGYVESKNEGDNKNGNGENRNSGGNGNNGNKNGNGNQNEMNGGTDIPGYTRRFQELMLMCPKMVPKEGDNIERNSKNKRRFKNQPQDNRMQQPPYKRQNMARSYTARTNEKKDYAATLPYCNKCKLHHSGPCTVKCLSCKKVGHMASDYKNQAATTNQRASVEFATRRPQTLRSKAFDETRTETGDDGSSDRSVLEVVWMSRLSTPADGATIAATSGTTGTIVETSVDDGSLNLLRGGNRSARIIEESVVGDLHLLRDGPSDTDDDECIADEDVQGDALRLLQGDDDEEWNLLRFASVGGKVEVDGDERSATLFLHLAMIVSYGSGGRRLSDKSLSKKSPDDSDESKEINKNRELMGAARRNLPPHGMFLLRHSQPFIPNRNPCKWMVEGLPGLPRPGISLLMRRKASPCTSSSAIHSSSSVSDGPSRKRCRSPTTDSSIIRADLLPPRKRLRDPSSTYCHKVSVEVSTKMEIKDSIEAGAEGDIERDTDDCPAITADTTTDAVAAVEGVRDYEVKDDAESSARGTAEIRIDVVTELEVPDDIPMPIIVESGSRKTFEIGIRVLEGSNIGLQDTLGVKREMTASIERSLGYVESKNEGDNKNGNGENRNSGGNGNNGNKNGNGNQNEMNGGARGAAPIAKKLKTRDNSKENYENLNIYSKGHGSSSDEVKEGDQVDPHESSKESYASDKGGHTNFFKVERSRLISVGQPSNRSSTSTKATNSHMAQDEESNVFAVYLVARFNNGLQYDIQAIVSLQTTWTLDDAVRIALKAQQTIKKQGNGSSMYKTKTEANQSSNSQSGGIKCYRCQEVGHTSNHCRATKHINLAEGDKAHSESDDDGLIISPDVVFEDDDDHNEAYLGLF
nr:reverse transcriptase domain-containing protein [Tanacetum cinerariifolium]